MSETNDPDYKWRPAAKFDIGSIARFSDDEMRWIYGILKQVRHDAEGGLIYCCDDANQRGDLWTQSYSVCQIQYDANKEP
jgi:hypothetical protein